MEIINRHFKDGGTGVTNFNTVGTNEDELPLYEAAVAEYGDPNLVIHDKPMPPATQGYSLHFLRDLKKEENNLSGFWNVFWRIKRERAAKTQDAA